MLKIGTVFSGIGAFEQALNKLNIKHQILFACDNDRFVKQSYFANYDIDDNRWYNDIFDINGKKYQGKIDLFVGGSPCQSFSMIGFREGLKDKRGLLIFEFTRLIKEIQPQCFIFENVKGLLTHNKGKTWDYILKEFKSTGYHIQYQLLNAKDYGMPQSRTRLFVVGFKEKNNFEFPRPIELEKKMSDFLEHFFTNDQTISQKGRNYVLNEERMKKKITQINGGNRGIMLCQVRNQQSNFIGDFVSENFINSYNELDYFVERERERERESKIGTPTSFQPVFRAICSLG